MPEKLKNLFFTRESIGKFCDTVCKHYPGFERENFTSALFSGDWNELELKQKMRRMTEVIKNYLPADYVESIEILKKVSPEAGGFEGMVLPDYAEIYGLDRPEISLPALRHFTRYASAEFAIRPFLNADLAGTMRFMQENAGHEHENVRRFASEGCRPRLPWAMAVPALKKDPALIIPILEKLKDDESEFVRRSVANNLNDISKDHPEVVLGLCEKWYGKSDNTDKLIKHALRTLLKKGNVRAIKLFGYSDPADIKVTESGISAEKVSIGDSVNFDFKFVVGGNKEPKSVRLEYKVSFVKASGKTSDKVFKISEKEYLPGEYVVKKKHSFADMTTRKHYPGIHKIEIIVNGVSKSNITLEVV